MNDDVESGTLSVVSSFPRWLLFVAVMIYATGFMVVYYFFRFRFGLLEAGTEFLKIQYLHVGLIFTVMSFIFAVPIIVWSLRKDISRFLERSGIIGEDLIIDFPTVFLVFVMLAVFYAFSVFAPPGHGLISVNWYLLISIFVLTILGVLGVRRFINFFFQKQFVRRTDYIFRWLICLIDLVIAGYLFYDISDILVDVAYPGGFFFFGFTIIEFVLIQRIWSRHTQLPDERFRAKLWFCGVTLSGSLYYLRILVFSLLVFPHIPVAKGGGNFTHTRNVVVKVAPGHQHALADGIVDLNVSSRLQSIPLKLLHQSDAALFFVDPNEVGGPAEWPKLGRVQPQVFEFNRKIVTEITYFQRRLNGAKDTPAKRND